MFFRKRQKNNEYVLPQKSIYIDGHCERISFCASKKGSMTIEASILLPFFLLAFLTMFSLYVRFAESAKISMKLSEQGKQVGTACAAASMETNDGKIHLFNSENISSKIPFEIFSQRYIFQTVDCRAWIGYISKQEEVTYVYITPTGTVYHIYSDCSHLKLSIQQVSYAQAISSKNEYGSSYRLCEICEKSKSGQNIAVYITNEGDCYHYSRQCQGLKRGINCVPLSSVSDRACCQRCSQRGM